MAHNHVFEDGYYENNDVDSLYSTASAYTPTQNRQLSHMTSPMTPSLSFGSSNYSTAVLPIPEDIVHQMGSTMDSHAAATTAAQYYQPYSTQAYMASNLEGNSISSDIASMNANYGYCDSTHQQRLFTPIWNDMRLSRDAESNPPAAAENAWDSTTSQPPICTFAPPTQSWDGTEQMPVLESVESYGMSLSTLPAVQLNDDDQKSRTPKSHRRHPGDPKKKSACPVKDCGRMFSRTADMVRHCTRIHGEGGRDKLGLICDYYPKCTRKDPSFSRKDHLRAHLRDVHLEDLPKIGVNVHLTQAERDAAKKQQPHSGPSRRSKAVATPSAIFQEEQQWRSSSSVSGYFDGNYADSPSVFGQELGDDFSYYTGNDDEIEQDTRSGLPEINPVSPTWWRCSPCLIRVECSPNNPEETWECPKCHNKIEPDRQKAREKAAEEIPGLY